MAVPAWPGSLPQSLEISGFSEALPDVVRRTPMEKGPPQLSRKFTANSYPVNGQLTLTQAQLSTFKTFFNTTLLGGSLRFSWVDQVDGVTPLEYTFVETPEYTSIGGGLFTLPIKLAVMP
ncbi:MAG: hypothetical protein HQL70_09630 [Magnetococcales bacterium]|nr:hypothetical protein [Magnetococcales bacterium]